MLISTKGRYALQFMIYVARANSSGTVAVRYVAEAERISLKYLEQLARMLVQAGLLESVRGKGGGYRLAQPASAISAGAILRAAEGSTAPVECAALSDSPGDCPREGVCSTMDFWVGLDRVIEDYVDGVTLDSLAFPATNMPCHGLIPHDEVASEHVES